MGLLKKLEYIALTEVVKEALWREGIARELKVASTGFHGAL